MILELIDDAFPIGSCLSRGLMVMVMDGETAGLTGELMPGVRFQCLHSYVPDGFMNRLPRRQMRRSLMA